MGALAEEGSDVWRLFSLGATSFVTPGINLSTELATSDEPQGQLLIYTACNAEQAVTYTIASTDASILNAAGSGTVTFDAGGVPAIS